MDGTPPTILCAPGRGGYLMAIRKKKKKKEYNVAATMTYVPGLAINNSTISIPKELIPTLPPKPTVSRSSKYYMSRWRAWFYYTGITAGLPMGHETAGAIWGRAVAKRIGFSTVLGGGIGYFGALAIVGTIATIIDPLDFYEGGLAETRPWSYMRVALDEGERNLLLQEQIAGQVLEEEAAWQGVSTGAGETYKKFSWLMGYPVATS